jgi:hypothetical protein
VCARACLLLYIYTCMCAPGGATRDQSDIIIEQKNTVKGMFFRIRHGPRGPAFRIVFLLILVEKGALLHIQFNPVQSQIVLLIPVPTTVSRSLSTPRSATFPRLALRSE